MDYNLLNNYLLVGALVFSLGAIGFLTRRNLIVMFLCAEMMLQGVSLTLVSFSKFHGTWGGQVFAIFSLALAGAEAAIALALIVMLYRRGHSLDVSLWQDLREADQPPVPDEFGPETGEPLHEKHWPILTVAGLLPKQSLRRQHAQPPREGKQIQDGRSNVDQAGNKHPDNVEVPHV